MERIFPHALIACIATGRSPQLADFEHLADEIRGQAFAGLALEKAKHLAEIVADIAFHGRRTFR